MAIVHRDLELPTDFHLYQLSPSPVIPSPALSFVESFTLSSPPTPTAALFPLPPSFGHSSQLAGADYQAEHEEHRQKTGYYKTVWEETSTIDDIYGPPATPVYQNAPANTLREDPARCDSLPQCGNTAASNADCTFPQFYPTFGDWLPDQFPKTGCPGFDESEAKSRLGLSSSSPRSQDSLGLGLSIERQRSRNSIDAPFMIATQPSVNSSSPLSPFNAHIGDSFTFCPSTSFRHVTSSTTPPARSPASTLHPNSAIKTPKSQFLLPLTPPRSRSTSPFSLPPGPPPSMALPPTPPNFSPLPLPPPTPSAPSAIFSSRTLTAVPPKKSAYPLSPEDTARIATLHDGRVPSLDQLAPPMDIEVAAGAQPIVNTGNQGPMVVQPGDWKCGTCSFVNWRRRKICMRCFPHANDIGSLLTIQQAGGQHSVPASFVPTTMAPAPPTSFTQSNITGSLSLPPGYLLSIPSISPSQEFPTPSHRASQRRPRSSVGWTGHGSIWSAYPHPQPLPSQTTSRTIVTVPQDFFAPYPSALAM
ncbi:hypothetical protein T439DRAFT_87813 [Meredithblackwellia eburnea MCA 4105]